MIIEKKKKIPHTVKLKALTSWHHSLVVFFQKHLDSGESNHKRYAAGLMLWPPRHFATDGLGLAALLVSPHDFIMGSSPVAVSSVTFDTPVAICLPQHWLCRVFSGALTTSLDLCVSTLFISGVNPYTRCRNQSSSFSLCVFFQVHLPPFLPPTSHSLSPAFIVLADSPLLFNSVISCSPIHPSSSLWGIIHAWLGCSHLSNTTLRGTDPQTHPAPWRHAGHAERSHNRVFRKGGKGVKKEKKASFYKP